MLRKVVGICVPSNSMCTAAMQRENHTASSDRRHRSAASQRHLPSGTFQNLYLRLPCRPGMKCCLRHFFAFWFGSSKYSAQRERGPACSFYSICELFGLSWSWTPHDPYSGWLLHLLISPCPGGQLPFMEGHLQICTDSLPRSLPDRQCIAGLCLDPLSNL